MEDTPTWGSLFERGGRYQRDLDAVRAAIEAVRDEERADES